MLGSPLNAPLALLAALCALTFALAGCGDETSSDTRPLVTFAKSGGVGGKAYSLVVDRGGGATLTTYPSKVKKFNIGSDKRDELVGLLDGIKGVDSSYQPDRPSADDFRFSVTYQAKTVEAADSSKMPDDLRSVIDLLDDVVKDET